MGVVEPAHVLSRGTRNLGENRSYKPRYATRRGQLFLADDGDTKTEAAPSFQPLKRIVPIFQTMNGLELRKN